MQKEIWFALESPAGPARAAADWRRTLGPSYASLKPFLRPKKGLASAVPCPADLPCGCDHGVVEHAPDDVVAVCRCAPKRCQTKPISRLEAVIFEVDHSALGFAIAAALGVKQEVRSLTDLHMTWQIGTYRPTPASNIPILMTIQSDPDDFKAVVHGLVAKFSTPLVLISATDSHWRSDFDEVFRKRKARFLSLCELLVWNGQLSMKQSLANLLADLVEEVEPPARDLFVFEKKGTVWRVVFRGEEAFILDSKGMEYMQRLLANPNNEIHCTRLYGGNAGILAPLSLEEMLPEKESGHVEASKTTVRKKEQVDVNAVGDKDSLDAYKRRLDEIKEKIEEAEELGKNEEAGHLKEEQNTLTKEFGRLMYGGKARREGPTKKARQAVGNAINRSLDAIKINHQPLWTHLDATVQRGEFLIYRPDEELRWILNQ